MKVRTDAIFSFCAVMALAASLTAQTPAPGTAKPTTRKPGTTTSSSTPGTPTLKASDKTFVTNTLAGGQSEVELAALAKQKGTNPKIKALADRLETDHQKANDELKSIATQKGITPPAGPDKAQQATKARLEKLDGAAFDQAYAKTMVENHNKGIRNFETEAKSSDPELKGFAEKTLPTLKEHLKMAQDAQSAVAMLSTSKSTAKPSAPTGTSGKPQPQGGAGAAGSPGYPGGAK
jgi:putative membrane protein